MPADVSQAQASNDIGIEGGKRLLRECEERGLDVEGTIITVETALVTVLTVLALGERSSDMRLWATTMLECVSEGALARLNEIAGKVGGEA